MSWSDLTDWWLDEIASDPAYDEVVTPMLLDVLGPAPGKSYLDLGCGEGRVMRVLHSVGALPIGVELNLDLAETAAKTGPVVVGALPDIGFLRDGSVDGALCVLVMEHVEDHVRFLAEIARVVRPGGVLGLVMNHPFWTAPGSSPIGYPDGEVLWRPGSYFERGTQLEPAGEQRIVFHHRTNGDLLEAAASAGWSLERLIEAPHHELVDQAGIPRLLACRWRLLP
jgi:SAM-dependent methyltransferase